MQIKILAYAYYVVVQFYPWFKFHFPLFWSMVMYDNECETKENNILTKDKIEPQHIHAQTLKKLFSYIWLAGKYALSVAKLSFLRFHATTVI